MKKKANFAHSGHKLHYHLDRVLPWVNGERISPIHLELGIGPKCNYRCIFCFVEFQKQHQYVLKKELFLKIMRDSADAGVRSIGILGDGEPTLSPALKEAVQLGHELGMDVGLATNGLLFTRELARDILPYLVWVRFTTCAATPETFERIHRVPGRNFQRVIHNITESVQIKKDHGLNVTIGMQMIMLPENIHEALDYAKMARRLGVDYSVVKQASLSPKNEYAFDLHIYDDHQEVLREVERQSTDTFSSLVSWEKIASHGLKDYEKCYGYSFLMQVTGKGEVYPCNHLVGNTAFKIGDFNQETLLEMLHGSRYASVIANMDKELDPRSNCATCCRHDAINSYLWALRNPPDHINFI